MKTKKFVTLILLFALSFSVVHEYAFAFYDTNHCSTAEYIAELEVPQDHGDICDIHFEYHQSFLLTQDAQLPLYTLSSSQELFEHQNYNFQTQLEFFKPPIA